MKYQATLLPLVVVLIVSGCSGGQKNTVTVQGHELQRELWETDKAKILDRAAFDMNCSKAEISLTILDTSGGGARQVGAAGCEQKLTYVDPTGRSMWVANTSTKTAN